MVAYLIMPTKAREALGCEPLRASGEELGRVMLEHGPVFAKKEAGLGA